ncbi:uncharacterized protein LOC119320978 [Triticum dicoccoides]|uniref:uncharacterized protein LOC119320978 n=1 Tax=Triticum dicoccoides TaxID=85692 RepID=UPI00188F68FA|nr:uncharacterized protein LOC119320978 [Triticum dicoccoides]XP_044367844.1 uncharacterized protein LOC123090588 [Triticum aestivum]
MKEVAPSSSTLHFPSDMNEDEPSSSTLLFPSAMNEVRPGVVLDLDDPPSRYNRLGKVTTVGVEQGIGCGGAEKEAGVDLGSHLRCRSGRSRASRAQGVLKRRRRSVLGARRHSRPCASRPVISDPERRHRSFLRV